MSDSSSLDALNGVLTMANYAQDSAAKQLALYREMWAILEKNHPAEMQCMMEWYRATLREWQMEWMEKRGLKPSKAWLAGQECE